MRILHLEDSDFDAELVRSLLYRRWPGCSVANVSTGAAFESEVVKSDFDLILSDYSLPGYDGLRALAFARKHCPEKPFIYISGTIGEECAIEALKSGATDYILKDRTARLVPAIDAAISQAARAAADRWREEKLREQASLLDKSREAICVTEAKGCVTYWNASAERLYGFSEEEAIGRTLREMLYPGDQAHFDGAHASVLANGEWRGQLRPRSRNAGSVLVESYWSLVTDDSGTAKSIFIIDADITEKTKILNQILQSQRLETLGMMVGGIAHDLNNVLAPILTSVDLLRATRANDEELLEILDLSAHHGVELVRQLLTFARGGGDQRGELAVDAIVDSVGKLLNHALPSNIEELTSLDGELWRVNADATQIRQVLLNLCINARDAMPQGGRIEIRASNTHVSPGTLSAQGEAKGGPYVRISVADTGSGIPPEIIGEIFEPFFTTKRAGNGTGLGLVNVAEIIKSHGGFVTVESEPGAGTIFHVFLPALIRETEGRDFIVAPHAPLGGHGESVLIIEDDDSMRTVLEVLLSTRGYRVVAVANGAEGLTQLRTPSNIFALVITDLHMPGVSGIDVIRQAQSMDSPPRLVALSGLTPEKEEDTSALSGVAFLKKPITTESLLGAMRRALEGQTS